MIELIVFLPLGKVVRQPAEFPFIVVGVSFRRCLQCLDPAAGQLADIGVFDQIGTCRHVQDVTLAKS